jgi:hypothetical protein
MSDDSEIAKLQADRKRLAKDGIAMGAAGNFDKEVSSVRRCYNS